MYKEFEFPKNDIFKYISVENVNHDPHPYTIGPKHIEYASKHHGGMLGQETIDNVPCAVRGCQLTHAQHKSDKLLFLSLLRNASKEEVNKFVVEKLQPLFLEYKIDGISFIETKEKYRIS